VGQFHGGIADNVVPRDAEFRYEFRDLPTADVARAMQQAVLKQARALEPAMQAVAPEAGFRFDTICEVPSFLGSADDAVTRLALRLSGEGRTTLVAFGTEAGLFKNAGIPTVVCGPGFITQAHQPDEFVSLEQLARCEAFMRGPRSQPLDRLIGLPASRPMLRCARGRRRSAWTARRTSRPHGWTAKTPPRSPPNDWSLIDSRPLMSASRVTLAPRRRPSANTLAAR
jgi:hypothetical protein